MRKLIVFGIFLILFNLFVISSVSAISACGTIDSPGVYTLTQNITAATTCLTINSNHILLDCQGFNITFGTGGAGAHYGVNNSAGYDNITVQNCIIWDGSTSGTSRAGISMGGSTENSTLFNNRITMQGNNNRGIVVSGTSTKFNISYNSIITMGQSSSGILLNPLSNSIIDNNIINTTTTTATLSNGITNGAAGTKNNFTNNLITVTSVQPGIAGIYLTSGSSNSYIFNNTFNMSREAIVVDSSLGTNISSNKINTTGGRPFSIQGNIIDHFNITITQDNLVNGLPVMYNHSLVNRNITADANLTNIYGFIACGWCIGVNITNISIGNSGVAFFNVTNGKIAFVNYSAVVAGGILLDFSSNNRVFNNTLNMSIDGDKSTKGAITIQHGGANNYVANNTIFAALQNKYAIQILNASYNIIENNLLTAASDSANTGGGIIFSPLGNSIPWNNTVSRNNITIDSATSSLGIVLDAANGTFIFSNIINSTPGRGIVISSPSGFNTLVNNNISAFREEVFVSSPISFINFLIFNNTFGRIEWFNNGTGSSLENISYASSDGGFGLDAGIIIRNNTIAFNTSSLAIAGTRLNSSANISLFGLQFGNATNIYKTSNVTTGNTTIITTGTICDSISCQFTSYSNTTGILLFNVSSLGSFAVNGSWPAGSDGGGSSGAFTFTQYPEFTDPFNLSRHNNNSVTVGAFDVRIFHLNESSGTTVIDSNQNTSTNGNGSCVNCEDTDWVPGVIGNGINLDGSDEFINTNVGLFPGNTLYECSAFTIGLWVNTTDTSGDPNLLGVNIQGNAFQVLGGAGISTMVEMGGTGNHQIVRFGNWSTDVATGQWECLVLTKEEGCTDNAKWRMYNNATELSRILTSTNETLANNTFDFAIGIGARNRGPSPTQHMTGTFDEVIVSVGKVWSRGEIQTFCYGNYSIAVGPTPTVSAINCTSCNIPFGDDVAPYTTADTTPTFKFNTDVSANCRIDDADLNYSAMGNSRDCSGSGTNNHTCTLKPEDELIFPTDYVYFGCQNSVSWNESLLSTSGALQVGVENLSMTTLDALDSGIQHSLIWPGATVYTDQQVYLRNLQDQQLLTTVDRVAVYGSQRWLLNIAINESTLGLFNISPAVYALDLANLSTEEIQRQVSGLINSTKR